MRAAKTRTAGAVAAMALLVACESDTNEKMNAAEADASASAGGDDEPGVHVGAREVVFRTEPFTLEPGQERYLCYAAETDEALVIDGYSHEGAPFLHHAIFSRTIVPEPDGTSECDIIFRQTWAPLFLSGAGASSFEFPDNVGHKLPAGSQLVLQLHMLNTSEQPITDAVSIRMQRASEPDPMPMGTLAFGTTAVSLPPQQETELEGVCQVDREVQLVAAFPHMHLLGTKMTFEVGRSEDAMEEVFRRDPYDFDDQSLELLDLTLHPGDITRVRCSYDNPHDMEITFGESTLNEMCYFVGFEAGTDGIDGCMLGSSSEPVDEVPIDPAAGECGEHEPTDTGIGLPCTSDGSECAAGLMCSAMFSGEPDGVCIQLGCETDADCGDGGQATCCAPEQGGGSLTICIPEACRTPSCTPTE